ncbi:MAG: hypothetical protein E7366_03415 [Clostridiales bacterium]|nr:hypothetical protein [Clostridiales bacterium]
MANLKKWASLCALFLAFSSVCALAGCKDKENSDSSPNTGDSANSSVTCTHVWNEWTLVRSPNCDTDGEKKRICSLDTTHVETAKIAKRGHNYANTGVCETCGTEWTPPAPDKNATYENPDDDSSDIMGTGDPFDRYEMQEGYYEVTIGQSGEAWLSFATAGVGQYALYTVSNPDKIQITRHDASSQYIPSDDSGEYIGFAARVLSDGNSLSTVSCPEQYWSEVWRATFRFKGEIGSTIRVRFMKMADPAWVASTVREEVHATQLTAKAPEGLDSQELAEVPYDTEYFFDESAGYYRIGTKDNPGEIIYVAIDYAIDRLFQGESFVGIQAEFDNLTLPYGKTVEGDNIVHAYHNFIVNEYAATQTTNEGVEYVWLNSDGLYPVNQELKEFLDLFLAKNKPSDEEISAEDWQNKAEYLWLSACFYYTELTPGTEEYPYEINQLGAFTVTTQEYSYVYYKIVYPTATTLTLTSTDEKANVIINGITYKGVFSVTLEVAANTGIIISATSADGSATTYKLTLSEVTAN